MERIKLEFDETKKYTSAEMEQILEFAIEIVNSENNILFSDNEVKEIGGELGISNQNVIEAIKEVNINEEINQIQEQIKLEIDAHNKVVVKIFVLVITICFIIELVIVKQLEEINFTFGFALFSAIIMAFKLKSFQK